MQSIADDIDIDMLDPNQLRQALRAAESEVPDETEPAARQEPTTPA